MSNKSSMERVAQWARLLACLLLLVVAAQRIQAMPSATAAAPGQVAKSDKQPISDTPDGQLVNGVVVGHDIRHDTSPALRNIHAATRRTTSGELGEKNTLTRAAGPVARVNDPVVQRSFNPLSPLAMPRPTRNFEGVYNYWGYYPPDTNGDVGPNHYVQIVNVGLQIFSKTGATVYGPTNISTLWRGFGGVCEARDDGDPIVLYDPIADRWMVSQFNVPGGADGYHQCMAVSTSGDPTDSYYRYDFLISQTLFNDYPHYGVWPDGYYAAFDMFRNNTFVGSEPVVFNRARMLAGQSATFQAFPPDHNNHSMLPADLDGSLLPPAGEPNIYATIDIQGRAQLRTFNFHVDWANPSLSSFTPSGTVVVAPFNTPCLGYHNCISQPGTTQRLDALADRLMFRLAYRNFGDHQAVVTNHTVDVSNGGAVNTGVRWYELRSPAGAPFRPSLYQQGTYAPDADNRWMGSVALDRLGNMAVGYSVSSSATYPSIRYTGRLASDPVGTLPQGEATLITGSGSQTGVDGRWGDYSMMAVDPSDDCTFWYTTEYYSTTAERSWRTRIGSFKFRGCDAPASTPTPARTATSTPIPSPTATPCAGNVTYTGSIANSDPVQTGRLARDGVPSTCAAPKTCPGAADSTPRHYDSYTYTNNTSSAKCVTVTIAENCGNNALLSAAYLNTYNPANMCANYLADMGVAGPIFSYSFTLPANSRAVVVVVENSANIGCSSYTLKINPCASR